MAATLRVIRVVIGHDPPARLDKALARDVPEAEALSRSRLARLITEGAVRRGGAALTDAKTRVAAGEEIEIALPEAADPSAVAEAIPLAVVYEDADLIVVDKPAGMVVHPAPGNPSGTLVNALLGHCGADLSGVGGERRPGIVHRIDKDTSGLIVAAKSDAAHHGLAAQFEAHSVERAYLAVCHGCPDPADARLRGLRGVSWEQGATLKVSAPLSRHRTDRQRQAVTWAGGTGPGRHAVTRARVIASFGQPRPGAALLECRLETGRTHQIRVHLAYAGHALVGDETYGGRRKASVRTLGPVAAPAVDGFPRQALHAATLGFEHPVTGAMLRFERPPPADLSGLIAALGAE